MSYSQLMDQEPAEIAGHSNPRNLIPFSAEWVREHCSAPPTPDDVIITLDGTPITTVAQLHSFLESINDRRTATSPSNEQL